MNRSYVEIAQSVARECELTGVASGLALAYKGQHVSAGSTMALAQNLSAIIYHDLHAGITNQNQTAKAFLVDEALERQVLEASPRRVRRRRAVYIGTDPQDRHLLDLDGVRVHYSGQDLPSACTPGDLVHIEASLTRPRLSPGFCLTESSERLFAALGPILRIYLHLSAKKEAPSRWRAALDILDAMDVPYRAKVLTASAMYPRHDALVIYLSRPAFSRVFELGLLLASDEPAGAAASPFTRQIAPGVGIAFEPADSRSLYLHQSFGQHRSQVVAEAVVQALQTGEPVRDALTRLAQMALIDLENPWRNISSPDIEIYR